MSGDGSILRQGRVLRYQKVPPAASDGAPAQRHSALEDRLCVMRDGLVDAPPAGKLGQKRGQRRYYRYQ